MEGFVIKCKSSKECQEKQKWKASECLFDMCPLKLISIEETNIFSHDDIFIHPYEKTVFFGRPFNLISCNKIPDTMKQIILSLISQKVLTTDEGDILWRYVNDKRYENILYIKFYIDIISHPDDIPRCKNGKRLACSICPPIVSFHTDDTDLTSIITYEGYLLFKFNNKNLKKLFSKRFLPNKFIEPIIEYTKKHNLWSELLGIK
mgnify:CR=1 FL=1